MKQLALLALLVGCKDAADDYIKKSKATEADLMLHMLAKKAKYAHDRGAEFPVGKAGPTPATSCCPDKCQPDPKLWSTPPWSALGFSLAEPHLFQYTYESDGKTFTATAIGDLDCDTTTITYTLTGKIVGTSVETFVEKPSRVD